MSIKLKSASIARHNKKPFRGRREVYAKLKITDAAAWQAMLTAANEAGAGLPKTWTLINEFLSRRDARRNVGEIRVGVRVGETTIDGKHHCHISFGTYENQEKIMAIAGDALRAGCAMKLWRVPHLMHVSDEGWRDLSSVHLRLVAPHERGVEALKRAFLKRQPSYASASIYKPVEADPKGWTHERRDKEVLAEGGVV